MSKYRLIIDFEARDLSAALRFNRSVERFAEHISRIHPHLFTPKEFTLCPPSESPSKSSQPEHGTRT